MAAIDGRRRRALATQQRVIEAAAAAFIRRGYVATTMALIAEEAGVAVQSLYLRFGSKLAILKAALDIAIVGDMEPIPLLEREWVKRLAAVDDGYEAVSLFVDEATRIFSRTHALYAVIQAASAGDAGILLSENRRQRREGNRAVAQILSRKAGFDPHLKVKVAADIIYGLVSEDTYGLLVVDCGWRPQDWSLWCAATLAARLYHR